MISSYQRQDNRMFNEMRKVNITRNFTKYSQGSVLIEVGETKVICTATIEDGVPPFLKGSGSGWISAEYSMLPSSTQKRKKRDINKGKIDGRTQEIQRLIGRSIRSIVNLKYLGERTIWIDCDVIQADGGTRTASITGAYVAICDALYTLFKEEAKNNILRKKKEGSNQEVSEKELKKELKRIFPIKTFMSAVSVGVVDGNVMLDVCYEEDSSAEVDCNVVMNNNGDFIEIQGTGEERPFSKLELVKILEYAEKGNRELMRIQRQCLGEISELIMGCEYKKEIVVATGNAHKLEEIKKIFDGLDYDIKSLKDLGLDGIEIIEDGNSFEHNALIKARTIMQFTDRIVLADDSGLEVDCLNKSPGIYSARYAGENATDENNRKKLFDNLEGISEEERTARFIAAIAVVFPDGEETTCRGSIEGRICLDEKGDNGFGYDPMFIPDGYSITFAEMDPDEKNRISHRSVALDTMKTRLEKIIKSRQI